jgi:hypothetical protein
MVIGIVLGYRLVESKFFELLIKVIIFFRKASYIVLFKKIPIVFYLLIS